MKTKPNIKPNEGHTQDVKPNIEFDKESKPDMNKITYEEERLRWYWNNICPNSMVDVQMTYLLLVFVMKYV